MQIKYLGKEHTINTDELAEKTVGGLKSKIKEVVPQCANLPSEKIILFYNKAKITGGDEMSLSDSKLQITNDSVVFVIVLPADSGKGGEAAKKAAPSSNPQHQHQQHAGAGAGAAPFGMGNAAGGANSGAMPMNNNMFEQVMKNPEFLNTALEFAMQNASPEEKAMTKSMMENMKSNPELMQQMLEKAQGMMNNGAGMPMMSPYGMNPYMQGSPMHNPMMNSPMMNSQMGSQMGSPMMNPYMMNPYMMNPYMMGPQQMQNYQNTQAPPPNGPCSHGFYPLKEVGGQKVPQSAEDVYGDKLRSLSEMGFSDKDANLKALIQTNGDLSEAIETLTKNHK